MTAQALPDYTGRMSRAWKVFLVLLLGVNVDVPTSIDPPGWGLMFTGPAIAVVLYCILTIVALVKVLDRLPGIFALHRPLGKVRSGYEYLWAPAIMATLVGFRSAGAMAGRVDPETAYWTVTYGSANDSIFPLAAFGVFALMMWSLKLLAAMDEANRRLAPDRS